MFDFFGSLLEGGIRLHQGVTFTSIFDSSRFFFFFFFASFRTTWETKQVHKLKETFVALLYGENVFLGHKKSSDTLSATPSSLHIFHIPCMETERERKRDKEKVALCV